jgi:hypothetical protein
MEKRYGMESPDTSVRAHTRCLGSIFVVANVGGHGSVRGMVKRRRVACVHA